MVVADPSAELLSLITSARDPAPHHAGPAEQAQAMLVRRRFAIALPPPFIGIPTSAEPVRIATAHDGAAIAAVKWRTMGTSYRGVLSDTFLDNRDVVPPPSFWTGRAMFPPSRRHRLLVWGRPGAVFGYADLGPVHPDDRSETAGSPLDRPVTAGEVYELYVDPSAQGHGGGTALLAAAHDWLAEAGFERAELSVLALNEPAQAFYRSNGWEPTGRVVPVDLGTVAFDEVRLARTLRGCSP